MVAVLLALQLIASADSLPVPAADSSDARAAPGAAPDSARSGAIPAVPAPADSAAARPVAPARVVRQFPTVNVRAPLHDMRSSESVQIVSGTTLRR